MTLRPLSFASIVAVAPLGFFLIGLLLFSFRRNIKRRGSGFLIAALACFFIGSMREMIRFPNLESNHLASNFSAALVTVGYALTLAGIKASIGLGAPVGLSLAAGGVGASALIATAFIIPGYMGVRTFIFSAAFVIGGLALLWRDRKAWGRSLGIRALRRLTAAIVGVSTLRLVASVFDLRFDRALPSNLRKLAFFLVIALGLISYGVFIALVARQRGYPSRNDTFIMASLERLRASGLSETELRYAAAALEGRSYARIAAEAGVAESTVRNTMAKAFKKCGVGDLKGLILYCKREP